MKNMITSTIIVTSSHLVDVHGRLAFICVIMMISMTTKIMTMIMMIMKTMALTFCVPLSTESTTAPPVKFATLGRPVKRPMLTMASRGGTIIHALYGCRYI